MNTLIVFEMFEDRVFVSLPPEVYKKYKKKIDKCHGHFINAEDCPDEVYWFNAAIATEYVEECRADYPDAGCLGQYQVEQGKKPLQGPFALFVHTGFLP